MRDFEITWRVIAVQDFAPQLTAGLRFKNEKDLSAETTTMIFRDTVDTLFDKISDDFVAQIDENVLSREEIRKKVEETISNQGWYKVIAAKANN